MPDCQATAKTLFLNGYCPLRLEPGEKYTKATGWSTDTPTEQKLDRVFARPSNIGVRLGDILKDGTCLIAIDIDIEDMTVIRAVERAIGEKVPCKRGKKGYTYFVRLDRELKTHKIYLSRPDETGTIKKKPVIDVLARGAQTVVPPSIHPETQLPYTWVSKATLLDVVIQNIPIYTPALIDEIRGFLKNEEDKIHALNDMEWRGVGGGGNTHDICTEAVASMVARKWTDEDIQTRIQRAKREAAEASGLSYDWPTAEKVIQEWIDSSRDKKFDVTTKARVDDIPVEMFSRYAYVVSLDRMFDVKKGTLLDKNRFDNIHARDFPKPWASILVSPDLKIYDKLTYAPGQPKFCQEKSFDSEVVLDCINVYTEPDIEPDEGDVSPWLKLVEDVFGGDKEAINHVVSFLAFMVQFPGQKINHAIVLQGMQGIGKDSIFLALSGVLGQHNVKQVSLQEVESQFNDWLFGKQLIVYQEMLAPGRRAIYNKLKTTVTDPILSINTKHIALQHIYNRTNFVFLTNYEHALSIDPDDRRMYVWHSKMTPKPKEYYIRFYQWLADKRSAGYLMRFLLDYDTSKFVPSAPPPMTAGKRTMISRSSSEIEQFLREAAENKSWPLASDLVNPTHLMSALRQTMRVSQTMLHEALDHICGKNSSCTNRPRVKNDEGRETRVSLRAIRNQDKWVDAAPRDLLKEYLMPLPPQQGETEGSYRSLCLDNRGDPAQNKEQSGPSF